MKEVDLKNGFVLRKYENEFEVYIDGKYEDTFSNDVYFHAVYNYSQIRREV